MAEATERGRVRGAGGRGKQRRQRGAWSRCKSEAGEPEEGVPEVAMDWREFRARLVARETESEGQAEPASAAFPSDSRNIETWAHSLGAPEGGCILVAKPVDFGSQSYFNYSVILVLEHTSSGSVGLLLNQPDGRSIGEIAGAGEPFHGSEHPLWFGGDVGSHSDTLVLHPTFDPSAIEILPSIYLSNVDECQQLIDQCKLGQSDMRIMVGYCGWAPNQLEQECSAGAWWPCACSSSVIFSGSENFSKIDYWRDVIKLCGGDVLAEAEQRTGGLDQLTGESSDHDSSSSS